MYTALNIIMKFYIFLICILLTGCYTAHTVYYKSQDSDVDKKIKELKQIEESIDNKHKALEKYVAELGRDRLVKIEPTTASAPPESHSAPIIVESAKLSKYPIPSSTKQSSKVIKSEPQHNTVASQLYSANAVFSVPNKANITEDIKAQLLIDPNKTIEELQKSIKGQIQSAEKIKVSKIVIAKIEAPDFIITNLSPNEQALSETDKTEWLWTLRPKSPGLHEINLTITAEVTVDSKFSKYHIRTFDKQVMIEITPIQIVESWWSKYWQWVFATLLIPFGKWLYEKRKNKKED